MAWHVFNSAQDNFTFTFSNIYCCYHCYLRAEVCKVDEFAKQLWWERKVEIGPSTGSLGTVDWEHNAAGPRKGPRVHHLWYTVEPLKGSAEQSPFSLPYPVMFVHTSTLKMVATCTTETWNTSPTSTLPELTTVEHNSNAVAEAVCCVPCIQCTGGDRCFSFGSPVASPFQ
jgi:hypothetical protein